MKFNKVLVTGIAVAALGLAMTVGAAGYTFSNYLSVGSTGADVTALQTWLIANGFSIPSIASGAASKGYFGSQTKAAVVKYQASVGLPSTGFVGPLTIAKLNAGSTASAGGSVAMACPAGFVCTPVAGTPNSTTPAAATGISTPGVAGTLAFSIWTTPSGVTAYKGQSYDIAGYKLQANASDMAVTSFSLDFNTRLWLYANAITVKDETGAVVGQLTNLNASNFSELTTGSDYRVAIPVNLVVRATQSKYLTVNVSFNAVSDRSSGTIVVTEAQIRAVDGTGVTDTQTRGTGAVSGVEGTDYRSFSYQGSNIGQLVTTIDSSSPGTGLVQVSTAAQTQNVVLGIFDVKVQNEPGTLQTLNVNINSLAGMDAAHALANVQLKAAGQTYSASSIGTTTSFTNLNIPLAADTYVPMTITATVVQDLNNILDSTILQTTLTTAGTLSTDTSFNPSVIDATYNTVVNSSVVTLTANAQSFSATGVSASNLAVSQVTVTPNQGASTTATWSFSYSLTAGSNPVYVSATSTNALTTSSVNSPGTISLVSFRDSDSTNDSAGQYFYIAPGTSKTFTATYKSSGNPGAVSGTYSITALNYGTGFNTTTHAITGAGSLSASTIGNTLIASLAY